MFQSGRAFAQALPIAVLLLLLTVLVPLGLQAQPAPEPEPGVQAPGDGAPGDAGEPETAGPPAQTPEPEAVAAPASLEQQRALLEMLRDDTEREQFITRLEALIAAEEVARGEAGAQEPDGDIVAEPRAIVDILRQWLRSLEDVTLDVPELGQWAVEQVTNPFNRRYWQELATFMGLVLGAGIAGFWLVYGAVLRPQNAILARPRPTLFTRIRAVVGVALLRALPIIAFAGASIGVLIALGLGGVEAAEEGIATMQEAFAILAMTAIKWLAAGLAVILAFWLIFMPENRTLRPLPLNDEDAGYFFRWCRRIVLIVVITAPPFLHENLLRIPETLLGGIERAIGLVLAVLVIRLILQRRQAVATRIRGRTPAEGAPPQAGKPSPLHPLSTARQLLANTWHVIAILYTIAAYLIWALGIPGGFRLLAQGAVVTAVVLLAMQPLARRMRVVVRRQIPQLQDYVDQYPGLARRSRRYQQVLGSAAYGLVLLVGVYVILLAWGIDLWDWVVALLGETGLQSLEDVLIVLAVTFVLWEIIGTMIENYLERTDETGARVERSGREKTLLPLLRTALIAVTGIVVVMVTMSSLGVDIGPLLATAGIFGIAIGFGAQTLVQDIITGLFILIQDTVAVGDVVQVAGHGGLVESINIRTIILRDLEGTVHTIPFSQVSSVSNLTKDFSYALFDIGVAYREDVDEVIEVITQVAAELETDPQVGQFILEPIEILGLDQFADSAVVIKCRIRTKPIKQWAVKREYNRRLKKRFDELDIEIPFPHQTVYFGQPKARSFEVLQPEAPEAAITDGRPVGEPDGTPSGSAGRDRLYPERGT
ncbi:MAG: mechanosensitive ion channel [Alphaproteobacteria bacterium]|jgi:small conductance mechanosensitive channel|nr:mechanosensitive ion channel [Alphaproteobacteria bacterium]